MNPRVLLAFLALAACSDDPIGPDPTGGEQGGSTANAPTGAGGTGGAPSEGGTSSTGGRGEGGRETPGLGYENGTRLRARTFAATDGASQFAGWRDTELGINCLFALDTAGTLRCFPQAFGGVPSGIYADAACTVPAASVPLDCDGNPPLYMSKVEACGGWTAFQVGPELATYYQGAPGNCTVVASPDGGYRSLTPVPSSAFVGAEEQVD